MSILPHPAEGYGAGNSGPGWPSATGAELEIEKREQAHTAVSAEAEAKDTRDEESPAVLLQWAANWARARGKKVNLDGRENTALIAAADFLQAMGLKPVTLPTLRPRP